MDRQAQLSIRAREVSRRIFAGMSFGDRLAAFFVRLSFDTVETLGRAIGAEFLLRGVTEMPDPGPRWNPGIRNPAMSLPVGYMRTFASSLYGLLIKKFHNPEIADDAIQTYLARVLTSKEIKPVSRAQAESYVRDGVMKVALTIIKRKRREEAPLVHDQGGEDEGQELFDSIADPQALRGIERELSPRVWKLWMNYLAQNLHPDIPEYIGYSMEGFTDGEIVGKPGLAGMLPHVQIDTLGQAASFWKHKINRIPEVSQKFFKTLHEEMPGAV